MRFGFGAKYQRRHPTDQGGARQEGFSPTRSTHSFTIAASDYSSLTIIPPLVERLV